MIRARPRRNGAVFACRRERVVPRVLAAAFSGSRRAEAVACTATISFGAGVVQRFTQDLSFERLLAKQSMQLGDLHLKRVVVGGQHDLLAGRRRCEGAW